MADNQTSRLYGIVAGFTSADAILDAAARTRDAGYTCVEAYTPFMVEGLAERIGFRRSRLPALFLAGGILGALGSYFMCYWAFAVSLRIDIGGKPYDSWPAWVPIAIENAILFAALFGGIGMLLRNGLPRLHHPIFDTPGFERATRDRFFLCVEAADPRFDETAVTRLLTGLQPESLAVVEAGGHARRVIVPRLATLLLAAGLLAATLSAAGCEPNSDMANQPRYSTYHASSIFPGGASARPIPVGTVDRSGTVHAAPATLMGHDGNWLHALPPDTPWPFPIDAAALRRGQVQFDIYCAPCHSRTGDGTGMVVQRGFPQPPSLTNDRLRHAPAAYFVDVITHGIGAMYSYADRVPPDDRWRIAAYIRALQLSRHAPLAALSPADRAHLPPATKPATQADAQPAATVTPGGAP